MKFYQVFLLVACVLLACLACSNFVKSEETSPKPQPQPRSSAAASASASARDGPLPKIFDFDHFKSLFKKKYSSFVEELARKRIFLGRAFRAFLSFVGYKNYKNDSYLKINEMSDWTHEEHQAILKRTSPFVGMKVKVIENPSELLSKTPVADMKDIQAELSSSPELIAQLSENTRLRRRRDVDGVGSRSRLTVKDLMSSPESENSQIERIPSNNPEYEAPELASFGAEDDSAEPMQDTTASFISSLPGASYVKGIYNSLLNSSTDLKEDGQRRGELPDEIFVDHRVSGCFNPPKNQKRCGSCYIFSTTALYEWQFCTESGRKVAFSEQYPIDCGERVGMKACGGGMEYNVAQFYAKYGVEISQNYPYTARSDICPYEKYTSPTKMGYLKLDTDDYGGFYGIKSEYVEEVLQKSPLVMELGVPEDFSDYGGGVDSGRTCNENYSHSMVLIGSGREDGHEYWLFRNSYGTSWGVAGNYKLNKNAKQCLLDDGMGYFLRPDDKHATVFNLQQNIYNDQRAVKQRYYDVMNGRHIEKNPYNWDENEGGSNTNTVVTPPSNG